MATTQKNVQLSEENIKAFEEIYPRGTLSWVLDRLLEKFVLVSKMTPSDYAEIAARELKEELEHE